MQTSVTEYSPLAKEPLGEIEPRFDAELTRRNPEDRLELPDQVRWRNAQIAGDLGDWTRLLGRFEEHVASQAQPPEPDVTEQHQQRSCRGNLHGVKLQPARRSTLYSNR
jgi:hypothetical protein